MPGHVGRARPDACRICMELFRISLRRVLLSVVPLDNQTHMSYYSYMHQKREMYGKYHYKFDIELVPPKQIK